MLNIFYPPSCLHCEKRVEKPHSFCETCRLDFALLHPLSYCPYCLTEHKGVCDRCRKRKEWSVQLATCFDPLGGVLTLISQVHQDQCLETAASFLMVQLSRLRWPPPDIVIPVPTHRGSTQFVQRFAKNMQLPYCDSVTRRRGDLPQRRLSWPEREKLSPQHFQVTKKEEVPRILLIDATIGSGATMRAIATHFPNSRVYGLSLARELW